MKNPFEDIDRDALDPARQPPRLSLWLVALGVMIPTVVGVLMASGHAPAEKIRDVSNRVATLDPTASSGNNGGSMLASGPRKPNLKPPPTTSARSPTPNLGVDPEDTRNASIIASVDRPTRSDRSFDSAPATPKTRPASAPESKPFSTTEADPSRFTDNSEPERPTVASTDRPKRATPTLDDFFGPPPVGSEVENPFARPDFAGGPRDLGKRPRDRGGDTFGTPERPATDPGPGAITEPTRDPETPETSIDDPEKRDDTTEPDIDPDEDIVATIRRVRSEVEAELDKNFPLFKAQEAITIRNIRRQSYTGKVGFLGKDYLILLTRGGSERIPFNQLEGASRIRCDKTFRNDQVLAETRKRMTE